MAIPIALITPVDGVPAADAAIVNPGPVGNGFVVTPGDLGFILKQIKIAERHATTLSPAHPCDTLLNRPGDGIPDAEQVPDILTSYGLRTVDGSCNNLKNAASEKFAAADQLFPRLTTPVFRDAEPITRAFPVGRPGPTSYKQKTGNVVDSQPRVISNLIVDQTSTNPAAVAASGLPVRSQSTKATAVPCTTDPAPDATPPVDGVPAGCTPSHQTLFIPNITTDAGLSPPYNSMFTFFGQFFDHGIDQTVKSGAAVFVPLKADDPLITLGPDGKPSTGDEVQPQNAFMVLTRAQNQPGPDGRLGTNDDVQEASNTDTPWVDQSQTYTSHPAHQVFLREYVAGTGTPGTDNPAAVATGKLLRGLPAGQTYTGSPDMTGGQSTWASVKKQAHDLLGLKLVDADVTNVPMLATDPYGKYLPGPKNGLPQYVTATGLVEGQLDDPATAADETVPVPANVLYFDTPFVTDIAHNADPSPDPQTGKVPTPDTDTTVQTDFTKQPAGTYDDELLASHAACGDGRCNENIALTTIHQVFHSEHNRIVDDIDATLRKAGNEALLAGFQAADGPAGANGTGRYNYGERLFQAARFVTEMEYQHLVFEEFARKVQPAVRPFRVYSPDINPAIEAEFAHAVYRFGHSMLNDVVARKNPDGSGNDLKLLDAFLNPPALYSGPGGMTNGVPANPISAEEGAGSIIMGSSDQTGNEIDEFVTETLRNNLLGLPLDLAAINMARAREAGVPPLNDLRRQIFAATNDGQLAPYTSWTDFGQHLKHPESLINFVAAYGTHPSITSETTVAGKRAAARAIVDPAPTDTPPADAAAFMFGTGAWADDANGVTKTGLDDVDLWVGGLAEVTNPFGGLLGSTFNYVFQTQLEKLQDGDRLYYLARTPGLNLRTQLEGNSFSEIIQRNTSNTNTLKSDAFATADCKFQLSHLDGTAAGFTAHGAGVADDPATPDCNENLLLTRSPDGTISYIQRNRVDPPGINGQSVYQGTDGVDRINGGNDNDTFWGGNGNDVIEGNGGDDVALGGNGDDIITDLAGADVPKGGPGNDAIDGGIGDDVVMGNEGQDFLNGGANDNETFAGEGNDFIIAGQGADAVFGDGGDDWIEGGTGQDLLQGDHGARFFDDPGEKSPGNDILIGQPGENDYDAEGGDDIMAQNAAIDRNAGAGGFDWAIHQYDTVGADDDMKINKVLPGLPIQVVVNRDRWQETEADSGSDFNDVIRGDSNTAIVGGAGSTGCDALDPAGVARITGLGDYVTAFPTSLADVKAVAAAGDCPLVGAPGAAVDTADPTGPKVPGVWAEGNILFGGGGSDVIEGRANQDIIDGDNALNVAIEVHANSDQTGPVLGTTDLMENKALTGDFGPGTAGMTLQQAVFAGKVNPGQLVSARFIVRPDGTPVGASPDLQQVGDCPAPTDDAPVAGVTGSTVKLTAAVKNCDTAVFSKGRSAYTVLRNADGSVTVTDTASAAGIAAGTAFPGGDGIDTLWNVENLRFCLHTDAATKRCDVFQDVAAPTAAPAITAPGAVATLSAVAGNGTATLSFTPGSDGGSPITGFIVRTTGGTATIPDVLAPAGATSATVTGLANGALFTFSVQAINASGTGPATTTQATPVAPPATTTAPTAAPTGVTATAGNGQATVSWTQVPGTVNGGSAITGYSIQVTTGPTVSTVPVAGTVGTSVVTGLTNGSVYSFKVAAVNADGTGPLSVASNTVTPAAPLTAPGTPRIAARAGTAGVRSATLTWVAPTTGGAPASYTVQARNAAGTVLGTTTVGSTLRTATVNTGIGNGVTVTLRVRANNAAGASAFTANSNAVTTPTLPGAPGIGTAISGVAGGVITATAKWTVPTATGGRPITSYTVRALRLSATGTVLSSTTVTGVAPDLRTRVVTLPVSGASYRFTVQAVTAVGAGKQSARSNQVVGR